MLLREAGEAAYLVVTEPLAKLALGWHPPSRPSVRPLHILPVLNLISHSSNPQNTAAILEASG